MSKFKPLISVLFSLIAAVGYGIVARLAFGNDEWSNLFGTITIGFLFFTPLGLGALAVFFAPADYRGLWPYALLGPWLPCFIFSLIAAVFTWEAWICILMALPIFLAMSSIGGLIVFAFFKLTDKSGKSQAGVMGLLLLAPFVITPLENQVPVQDSIRMVHTQIEINADPEIVWPNITRVPRITEAERRFSFFHLAGLPRPLYATLSHEGVGGVRRGQWEDGLAFIETISNWRPGEAYTMQMEADTSLIQPAPLPLKEIGGRYFDVIEGRYVIEPISENKVILHFTSTYRLTTHFNFYGGLWTDFFMGDVQNYILQIIKSRCEAE